jgi:group I intron endonuclease
MATIYILENIINKKCYVGQTVKSFKKRLCRHIGSKYPIGNAIKKYGIENFKKYVYYGIPEELLDYFEVELIKRLNSLSPSGYNLTTGGNKNKHYSEETKKKLSELNSGEKSHWRKSRYEDMIQD